MPPKTVTCAICGETVLKAQTLAQADGSRACRTHEQVEETARKLQEKKKQATQISMVPKKHKGKGYRVPDRDALFDIDKVKAWGEHVRTHCWVCDCEGLAPSEFYSKLLIAFKRLDLRGEKFSFSADYHDKLAQLVGEPPLFPIPYDPEKDNNLYSRVRDKRLRDLLHFLKYITLCQTCISRLQLDARLKALFPEPTWEQVEAMMIVNELIEPMLEEEARRAEEQN